MRWKDPLALRTIVFADTPHGLVTEIGDREREGLLQGVRFLLPRHYVHDCNCIEHTMVCQE
jgi:hypothetical protein